MTGWMILALALAIPAGPALAGAPPDDAPAAGQLLAERLRSARPDENSDVHGTLLIHLGKQTQQIPVLCRVLLRDDDWETTYDTAATTNAPAEQLLIRHHPHGPSDYLYARAAAPGQPVPPLAPVSSAEADAIPLAGSDFSLGDLGLDFLYWPEQRRSRDETHLDRSCYALESTHPPAGGIARVKSYFDQESGGLLIADAFDADGHTVKTFSLNGSSFKKVHGHWRLEKMEIRNRKIHSQTILKFDIQP